ncbi:hypothetical protein OTU49_005478 [Cherax quadricarinatus]|uniref:Uncharacterized protein n=1 Tax=Cherax quadricarinatus TaxID=27406 RepID=A0AAW0X5U4_CHEQU
MATAQGYQQVVVVPTAAAPAEQSSSWRRRGVQVGGLMLGLPCAICLSVTGFVFLVTGIGIISSEAEFDSDIFDDDDEPLSVVGMVMIVIGVVLIAGCIWLCYAGHRAYKRYSNSEGRVISTAQTVVAPPGSYPVVSSVACQYPPGTQITTYTTSGGPPAGYAVSGQMAPYPSQGQYPSPVPGQPSPYPVAAGQSPYPSHIPGQPGPPYQTPAAGHPGPFPTPATGHPGPYPPPVGPYQPPPAEPYPTPYPGMQPAPPYQSQFAPEAPGLPEKTGLPGEMAPVDPYEKPPPYAP